MPRFTSDTSLAFVWNDGERGPLLRRGLRLLPLVRCEGSRLGSRRVGRRRSRSSRRKRRSCSRTSSPSGGSLPGISSMQAEPCSLPALRSRRCCGSCPAARRSRLSPGAIRMESSAPIASSPRTAPCSGLSSRAVPERAPTDASPRTRQMRHFSPVSPRQRLVTQSAPMSVAPMTGFSTRQLTRAEKSSGRTGVEYAANGATSRSSFTASRR